MALYHVLLNSRAGPALGRGISRAELGDLFVGTGISASIDDDFHQSLSTTSASLRGEPNSYNLIRMVDEVIDISVRDWRGTAWRPREDVATRVA